MGHIATPKGIDFNIQSTPLTNTERQELSDFIKKRKTQLKKSLSTKKKNKAAIYNDWKIKAFHFAAYSYQKNKLV